MNSPLDPSTHGTPSAVPLPRPRGPRSAGLLDALHTLGKRSHAVSTAPGRPEPAIPRIDSLVDDDLHLALYLAYELHYRGLPGVPDEAEWDPTILGMRRELETAFEGALRAAVEMAPIPADADVGSMLRTEARQGDGALSRYLERSASVAQFREFVIHRSAYHLKEADPHSFAIPRLAGPAKAAMVEIQSDEYGAGDAGWMHSYLFATTMHGLGLDPTYGAYLHRIPGHTLASVNAMSMFGLHRRLRGAAVGHLAMFELTSTLPNRRYGNGLRRLGFDEHTTRFFDEHVEADAVHEAIATEDLVGSLVAVEPVLAHDVVFGARALSVLDALSSLAMLRAWRRGRRSLRRAHPMPKARRAA